MISSLCLLYYISDSGGEYYLIVVEKVNLNTGTYKTVNWIWIIESCEIEYKWNVFHFVASENGKSAIKKFEMEEVQKLLQHKAGPVGAMELAPILICI